MSAETLAIQLEAIGQKIDRTYINQGTVVLKDFTIKSGRDAGRVVDVGLLCPDFPNTPPTQVYIRPILAVPRQGNVQPSCPLGPDWVYWSRKIDNWSEDRSAQRIVAFVNTVFEHA